jgi:hypothetical protein
MEDHVLSYSITYVGLNVKIGMTAAALADMDLREEVREHGNVADTPAALKALAAKFAIFWALCFPLSVGRM